MVTVFKFQEPDKLTDPCMGTADAIQRLEGAKRINHEAVEVDASMLDEDAFMPPGFRGNERRTYSIDEPIDVDGRTSTIRKEWGAANAELYQTHSGNEATSWHVLVFRQGQTSLDFNVSQEVYDSIQSGSAWSNRV